MSFFSELGLAEPILRALESKGYGEPTPIQVQAIPALLDGRDLLGIAQTGTGKTAAFSLPSLDRLAREAEARPRAGCRMLVLSPTRELAAQIAENMRGYAKYLDLSVQCVFGGVPVGKQAKALVGGCDVLVATPGRLLDLIDQRALTLRHVRIFVLDEADQMMDLGFIVPLKRVSALLPKERQSLFFSATMPKAIADLGKQFINNPVRVEVAPQATTAERVDQFAIHINQSEKQALLTIKVRDGLGNGSIDRALVFTRTKHGADRVAKHLGAAKIAVAAIHGNKSQGQRTAAIQGFRKGDIRVLVATDIAARGIDIPGVSHVYNFELPNVAEQYVHRIGRTARNGADGIAESFVAPDERPYLRDIEKLTGQKLMPLSLPEDFQKEAARLPAPSRQQAASAVGGERRSDGRRSEGRRSDGRRPEGRRSEGRRSDAPRGEGRREGGEHRRDGESRGEFRPRREGGEQRRTFGEMPRRAEPGAASADRQPRRDRAEEPRRAFGDRPRRDGEQRQPHRDGERQHRSDAARPAGGDRRHAEHRGNETRHGGARDGSQRPARSDGARGGPGRRDDGRPGHRDGGRPRTAR
jgi:ATP-dependent RNA helicase RhlE